MATHLITEHDLDRTDELPRLDVEAYEAKLAAEAHDTLVSTDSWEALHGLDETKRHDTAAFARYSRNRAASPEAAKSADVTLDATRILGRIAQLESELSAAKSRELELQSRLERATNELSAKDREARALAADHARIQEQRSLAMERLRTVEQHLEKEAARFAHDLAQQHESATAELHEATEQRATLESQVAELNAAAARLRDENLRLEAEGQGAAKLAESRTELIEHFKQRLVVEEKNAAQLARHLAAKIAEHATSGHGIERREATIRALESLRVDLTADLSALQQANEHLKIELAASCDQLASERSANEEREQLLTQRDERIAALSAAVLSLEATITGLTQDRDAAKQALVSERDAQAEMQQALGARDEELDQVRSSARALHARVAELEHDSHQVATLRELLNTKLAESQRLEGERDELLAAVDALRTELLAKQAALVERDEAQRAVEEIITDLRRINGELQKKTDETRSRLVQLEDHERQHEEGVLANAAELTSLRRQLGQQLATVQSLEQGIRARDTLADRLRGELQTTQDERVIIGGQLEKSRSRNKTLARELFARDAQIASLKADLAVHVETLAAIRQDVNRATSSMDALSETDTRILEPVGHDGDNIILDKKLMTIGRTTENDICVPSKLVSRHHARLLIGPNAIILEDAGSTNGCFVNDVQVKQHLVREGDVLSLGDLKYRLTTRAENSTRSRGNVIPFADGRQDND